MNNFRNDEQNKQDSRELRDNFKNIRAFMSSQDFESENEKQEQVRKNRDLRDNFKDIPEFTKERK